MDTDTLKRARKCLTGVERVYTERFEECENRVISTLEFCITALEQLKSWAVFAIFPPDEEDAEKYINFVEDRYRCISEPLKAFLMALNKDGDQTLATGRMVSGRSNSPFASTAFTTPQSPLRRQHTNYDLKDKAEDRATSNKESILVDALDVDSFHGSKERKSSKSPTTKSDRRCKKKQVSDKTTAHENMSRSQESHSEPDVDLSQELRLDLSQCVDDEEAALDVVSPSSAADVAAKSLPNFLLKDKINEISRYHMAEGCRIRSCVTERLQKCRKDMRIMYRWGQSTVMDLQEVMDDNIIDELVFIIRSKVSRVLSSVTMYEEAANEIEEKLSIHFSRGEPKAKPQHAGYESGSAAASKRISPYDLSDCEVPVRDHSPRLSLSHSSRELEAIFHPIDTDSGNTTNRSGGGTPEPPISPRPRALVNHPKITKDIRLQSMTLPSRFSGVNPRSSALF